MDSTSEAPNRRRRRGVFGNSMSNATDGVRTRSRGSFDTDGEAEEDIADSIVDINNIVEQKTNSSDPQDLPTTDLDIYDKETRLRYIHKMRMRDIPKKEMCKRLGITSAVLEKDIKELYSRLREGARKLDVNELIGDSIATYNEVLSMALNHASNKQLPTPTRLAALRTVLSAKNDLHRFLNLAGFYDVAVYKQSEVKADTDIGQLIKVTQAILNNDESKEVQEISPESRAEVEQELEQIRLF